MGKWIEQTILRRIVNDQQIHEEMFNNLSHKRNVNLKDTEFPSHPIQNDYHQQDKQQI
jgi:hypothetical protein